MSPKEESVSVGDLFYKMTLFEEEVSRLNKKIRILEVEEHRAIINRIGGIRFCLRELQKLVGHDEEQKPQVSKKPIETKEEKKIKRLESLLSNENFLNSAGAEVVEDQRQELERLKKLT